MAKALDNNSLVLTYEGEAHGAYLGGNPCVHERINTYLIKGTLPRDAPTCGS